MDDFNLTVVTAPTDKPVDIAELKAYLRVAADDESEEIYTALDAAIGRVERETRRALMSQTLRLGLPKFPSRDGGTIRLPSPPLQSITSIVYIDENGATQTLAADQYQADADALPGRVKPAYGCTWPNTRSDTFNAVKITYAAGWTSAALVPPGLRQMVLMAARDAFDNRGGPGQDMPAAYETFLWLHRNAEYP